MSYVCKQCGQEVQTGCPPNDLICTKCRHARYDQVKYATRNASLIAEAPATQAGRDRYLDALKEIRRRIDEGGGRHADWGIADFVDQILDDVGKCAACGHEVEVNGNSLCDSCGEQLAGGPT